MKAQTIHLPYIAPFMSIQDYAHIFVETQTSRMYDYLNDNVWGVPTELEADIYVEPGYFE